MLGCDCHQGGLCHHFLPVNVGRLCLDFCWEHWSWKTNFHDILFPKQSLHFQEVWAPCWEQRHLHQGSRIVPRREGLFVAATPCWPPVTGQPGSLCGRMRVQTQESLTSKSTAEAERERKPKKRGSLTCKGGRPRCSITESSSEGPREPQQDASSLHRMLLERGAHSPLQAHNKPGINPGSGAPETRLQATCHHRCGFRARGGASVSVSSPVEWG